MMVVVGLLAASLTVSQRTESRTAQAAEVAATPQLKPATASRQISFRDRLVTGLRARLKSEIDFVDRVVDEVHAGRIPQRLVDRTFFWARQKSYRRRNGRSQRPIIYFRPAMIRQAEQLDVTL